MMRMNKAEAPVIKMHSKSLLSTAHGIARDALFPKIDKSQTQILEGAIQCLTRI